MSDQIAGYVNSVVFSTTVSVFLAIRTPLSIDNNLSERLLRGVAIIWKNVVFVGSDRGEDRETVLYTLIETAKLSGLDLEADIAAIIKRMASGHVSKRLDALLPWNFETEVAKAT